MESPEPVFLLASKVAALYCHSGDLVLLRRYDQLVRKYALSLLQEKLQGKLDLEELKGELEKSREEEKRCWSEVERWLAEDRDEQGQKKLEELLAKHMAVCDRIKALEVASKGAEDSEQASS
jgi:hypothetical protein